MKGRLIYTPWDAEKNHWFISQMQKEGERRGCALSLSLATEDKPESLPPDADFIINRSRFASISETAEQRHIPSINNALTIRTANDKWESYLLFRQLHLPCMDTFLPGQEPPYPFVVKSRSGHGGSEVLLVHDREEYETAKAALSGKPFLLQPLCDEPGVDVRVYVMGDSIMAAVQRTSRHDFRSNYSLGGSVALFEPTKEMLPAIHTLQAALDSDYIGIDFIRHRGQWVLNEVEDAAGARMLYSLTDIPFIPLYFDQIERKLKKG